MSEKKVVEATGKGRINLGALVALTGEKVRPGIARVRVQKIRDGKVYEDRVIEYGVNR